jgi:hypothetical protein
MNETADLKETLSEIQNQLSKMSKKIDKLYNPKKYWAIMRDFKEVVIFFGTKRQAVNKCRYYKDRYTCENVQIISDGRDTLLGVHDDIEYYRARHERELGLFFVDDSSIQRFQLGG